MPRLRTVLAALLVCATLPLLGCLDYREDLTLNADGSGTLGIDFVVDLGLMAEVSRVLGEEPDPEAMQGPTEDEILQGLDVEGITVKDLKIQHKGPKSKVHLVIAFTTIDALREIEGFGDDRRIEFFDEGDGRVRVVYSFDTTDVIPIEEFTEDAPPDAPVDPIEKKILDITRQARDGLKFRAKITLPGRIQRSNGRQLSQGETPNARFWRIDKETDAKKHERLGRGKIRMMMLVERKELPFLTDAQLLPLPKGVDRAPRGPGNLGD